MEQDARRPAGGGPHLSPGEVLAGRYRVVSFLGEGAMGEVYEADDLELGEPVAIKILRADITRDDQVLQRFKREIQLARKVTHPNVSRVFDLVHHPGHPGGADGSPRVFLTMELLRGETLEDRLARGGRLTAAEALPIIRQIAAALEAAHAVGVVHRDLKSSNVFLVSSPIVSPGGSAQETRAVVTDFGLALSTAQASATLTATGELIGSPAYMAPEQVRGEEATPATDIYALGVVMYEMMTGELPFVGKSAFYTALLRLQQPAPSPLTRAPDLDPAWEAVILCCLEREPAGRFRHARHVVRALGVSLSEETTGFLPLPPHRPRRERLRRLWELGLLASAAVVIVVLVLLLRSRPPARPTGPATPAAVQAVTPVTPVPTRTAVAVLPFEDLARRPQTAYLRASLFQMLPTELAAASGLRPLPVEEVARARAELAIPEAANLSAETLSRLRSRLGADLVVSGAYLVTDSGRHARFDVQVQDARTGDTVTSFREVGSEAEFLAILARVGERLRQGLGQKALTPGEIEALRSLRPANLEAGRFYAEGLERLRTSEPAQARDFLLQATGLDPDNPLPHAALADAWSQLRYDLQAKVEVKRAHELSAGLPFEKHQLIEARWRESEGDWDGAIRIYRELRARYPDEIEHGLRLAAAQTAGSQPKDALVTLAELGRHSEAAQTAAFTGRIRLAEAEAAKRLSDYRRQRDSAEAAAAIGRKAGSPILVADALILQGDARLSLGELDRAGAAFDQAARLYDEAGYRAGAARAALLRGVVLESQNDLAGAAKSYEESLAVYRALGHDFGIASNLNNLAILEIRQGRFKEAKPKLEQALDVFLRVGRKDAAASALNNLGAIAEAEGDLATYETRLRAALDLYHELGNRADEARSLLNYGRLSFREGRLAEAAKRLDDALAVYRQSGDRAGAARALQDRGGLWRLQGDFAAAGRALNEGLKIQKELGETGGQAEGNLELASLALDQGDAHAAEARARDALALFRAAQLPEREAEALVVLARCRLAAGDTVAAKELIDRAEPAVRNTENPQFRVFYQIVESQVLAAAGQAKKAVEVAQAAVQGARVARTVPWELEARLALGEAETRAGRPEGPKELASLAQDAKAKGFGGIARRAGQATAAAR